MTRLILQAQPPLEFIPPKLNLTVVRLLQTALPALLRSKTTIQDIQAENVETLAELYRQFQAGQVRFLMAFRHPSADDPLCLAYLLSRLVPQVARQNKIALKRPIHAHFIYDRGIPLWAGEWTGWLYSQLGGTPIHRGKVDRTGLRSARDLFVNGTLPMAAAPEGATNGHSQVVSPLEPGISQLGFWCVEDLVKANRTEQVLIVPIGIQYRYITPPWKALSALLTELELETGLSQSLAGTAEANETILYQRLYQLGQHLLSTMEQFYTRFYHRTLPEVPANLSPSEAFTTRLSALLDTALRVAEEYFDLLPKGSVIDRCRRLEQAGWDYIFREDLKSIDKIAPVERGLADRIAEEADLRIWHMRLVESFVAVTGKYVLEKPTVERFAETALLMWDMVTRIKGGSPFKRPKLGQQRVLLTVGQPISITDRWEQYQESRRSAKQAVTDLTQDLQAALEAMVKDNH